MSVGSLHVNPEDDYNLTELERFSGPNVLEISEDELMEEWSREHGSRFGVAVWTMTVVVVVCVVLATGAVLLLYRYI